MLRCLIPENASVNGITVDVDDVDDDGDFEVFLDGDVDVDDGDVSKNLLLLFCEFFLVVFSILPIS